jgi:prolyl oligopeptidase
MKKGMSSGLMPPAFIIEQTPPQMEKVMNADPEKSIFYTLNKENKLTPEEKDKASDELKKIIQNEINPAYKKLYDFVKNEYLPNCRKDAGVWSLPDGQQRYESSVKYFTTLDLTADEIHNIGLKEVERIQKEMITLKDEIGFKGTLDEFNAFLKTDPQFYYTDKNNLMDGFRTILKKMDTKLPDLFGRLPEAKYDLFEMEEFRAKSAPAAYYYSAPVDRSRPGYFYVNTYNLPSRPKYTMTSLALHEAVPGHHLQISIAQELKNLPKFRRELGVTAFVEGWGLYAEHLGYESGMYEDLYQRYGALTFEMWRACRLVVDTGIHEKRWTREQARDFMKKYTPTSDLDIQSEVDRYISWPGQALAYKIGELKLKELRKNAEDRLGSKFNVKEFHDNVLKNGAIPLILLEKKINEWIDSKLNEN